MRRSERILDEARRGWRHAVAEAATAGAIVGFFVGLIVGWLT